MFLIKKLFAKAPLTIQIEFGICDISITISIKDGWLATTIFPFNDFKCSEFTILTLISRHADIRYTNNFQEI